MKKELIKMGIAFGMSLVLAVGSIVIPDYQVAAYKTQSVLAQHAKRVAEFSVNILDYDSNPTATEFSVNNVEGMEKLAELVNSGTESFDGKTVKMTDNIYFEKSKKNNHVPIGNAAYDFKGIFDGDNHVVSGMQITINQSHIVEYKYSSGSSPSIWVGLFGVIGGNAEIKNILMKDSEVKYGSLNTLYEGYFEPALLVGNDVSGSSPLISNCHIDATSKIDLSGAGAIKTGAFAIAAILARGENSTIQYCTNGASIKAEGAFTWVGGIAGYGAKKIKGCYNYGNITQIGQKTPYGNLSGIVGYSRNIEECVNAGNITWQNPKQANSAGISCGSFGIVNCYNTGKISGVWCAAGIEKDSSSQNGDGAPLYNVYNVGVVQGKFSANIYTKAAHHISSYNANHRFCYWMPDTNKEGGFIYDGTGKVTIDVKNDDLNQYSQNQMKEQAFVEQLNANSVSLGYGEVWKEDTEGINDGYPILKNVPYLAMVQGSDSITTEEPDEGTPDTTEVAHLFTDYTYKKAATKSTVRIYVNGGSVAIPGTIVKKNYKTDILYTDILASYKYSLNAKGKLVLATGKVIVGTTTTDELPVLKKGKIVDADAAKIATAKISHGQISVTAGSQSGKVYLWAIDTGDAGVSTCIPVTVKMAPSAMELYAVSDTDSSFSNNTKAYRKASIKTGTSTKVYLYPKYKDGKIFKKANDATYTVSVDSKVLPYVAVSKLPNSPYGFEIIAKKLKNGKSVTGKITFTCNQNGKKVVFNATVIK